MKEKKDSWLAKTFDKIFVERDKSSLLPAVRGPNTMMENFESQASVSPLNLNSIALKLFQLKNDKNAIAECVSNIGQNLRLRGKVKEAEKWAKISGHVQTLVQNAYNVQNLLAQIKRLALEEEVKELELEEKKIKLQIELETVVDLERKKKELESKNLELLIAQKELEIKKIYGHESESSPVEEASQAIEKKFELEKLIMKKRLEREKELKIAYDELIAAGYTPEEAEKWVEEEKQRLARMDFGDL